MLTARDHCSDWCTRNRATMRSGTFGLLAAEHITKRSHMWSGSDNVTRPCMASGWWWGLNLLSHKQEATIFTSALWGAQPYECTCSFGIGILADYCTHSFLQSCSGSQRIMTQQNMCLSLSWWGWMNTLPTLGWYAQHSHRHWLSSGTWGRCLVEQAPWRLLGGNPEECTQPLWWHVGVPSLIPSSLWQPHCKRPACPSQLGSLERRDEARACKIGLCRKWAQCNAALHSSYCRLQSPTTLKWLTRQG